MNLEIYFEFDTNRRTRGYSLKLKKKRFNTELRHFFTDRIINLWNSLDEQIVSSTSLNCFKNGLGTTAEATQTDGSCTCTIEGMTNAFWLLISWGWASPPWAEASTWRVTWWVCVLVRLLRYSYFSILFIILFVVINSFIRDLSSRRLPDTLHSVCLPVACLPSNSRKRSRKKTQH